MTTNYVLSDTLPKDANGIMILSPINDTTSQLDFGLLRGISSESIGATSKNVVRLGIATHTIGSALGTGHAGVVALGKYTESPSAMGPNNAQALRVDKHGALYVRSACTLKSISTASAATYVTGSTLLNKIIITFSAVGAGDSVVIRDGTTSVFTAYAGSASVTQQYDFEGTLFSTNINHVRTLAGGGATSITVVYSQL